MGPPQQDELVLADYAALIDDADEVWLKLMEATMAVRQVG